MKDIAELCKAAYENSKAHGFWDHDERCPLHPANAAALKGGECRPERCINTDLNMKIALIHSELSEALEEYRLGDEKRGGPLGAILYECDMKPWKRWAAPPSDMNDATHGDSQDSDCGKPLSQHKPVGFLVELADAAIRVFDLAGRLSFDVGYGVDLIGDVFCGSATTDALHPDSSIGHWLAEMHHVAGDVYGIAVRHPQDISAIRCSLSDVFGLLHELAIKVGGDLDDAIRIKMAYNATRPRMHGKVC